MGLIYGMRIQKSPKEFGFNRFDLLRLKKALKQVSDKRAFIRLKAVLLVAQGLLIQSVAELFDKSFQIVDDLYTYPVFEDKQEAGVFYLVLLFFADW